MAVGHHGVFSTVRRRHAVMMPTESRVAYFGSRGVAGTRYGQQAAARIPISVGRQTSQSFVVRAVP